MSNKLYITDTAHEKTPNEPEKMQDITKANPTQARSSYLAKNDKEFFRISEQVLDFMVNEETQFTDFIKIQDYFQSKVVENCAAISSNDQEIRKKEQRLLDIQKQINELLIKEIIFDGKHLEEQYKEKTLSLEKSM